MKITTLTGNTIFKGSYLRESKVEKIPHLIKTFLIMFFIGISGMNAQETVVDIFNLPAPERCVSNDLRVVEASLDYDKCGPTCVDGQIIEYPLTLGIFNNTGSMRTSFAFYARLEQYNPDGTLANTYFVSGCKGPVPPNATTSLTFSESLEILDQNGNPTEYDGIPYLCGGSLKLINLYQAWTDASDNDNRECPLVASKIAPKCDVLPMIEVKTPISAFVEDTSPVTCFGGNDGAIDITVNGGEAPYTYMWTKVGGGFSASTEDVSGLSAGTYNVTIKDAVLCPFTLEGIVIESVAILDADVAATNVSCYEGSDGSIVISNPSGGHGTYEYSIDGGTTWQSSGSFTGLSADTYEVYIRDAAYTECYIDLGDQILTQPAVLDADVASTNVTCFGDADGTITFSNASGGSGSFEYSIDGGTTWQTGTSFTGLAPDTYETYIRDANATDCYIDLGDKILTQPAILDADVASTNATCAGEANGTITFSNASGGSGSYEYSIDGGTTWQSGVSFTGLTPSTYMTYIRDANAINCEIDLGDVIITQPGALSVTATKITQVSCYGFEDGAIDITVTGGTAPFDYLWSNGAITEDVTGLDAGAYWVKVTDKNDCEFTLNNILVGEPAQVPAPVVQIAPADCVQTSGSFSIVDAPLDFEYSLDGGDWFSYTETVTGVTPGPHSLVARDAKECESQPLNFDVPQPFETPTAPTVTVVQPDCETLTGSILITSGTTGFMFSLNGADFVPYPMDGFTDLPVGNYELRTRSNDGCISDITSVSLIEPDCEEFEGCTLGYWKNHTDRWCDDYQTCDIYGDIFMGAPSQLANLTLLQVLNLTGGGVYNLGRQSVAALLNACSADVNYELADPAAVIAYVQANFNNAGAAGSYLDMLNNTGECPLGGSSATTAPSDGCSSGSGESFDASAGISISPVPFKNYLNIRYEFEYESDVTIQIFDLRGNLIKTQKESNASFGKVTEINADFVRGEQMYIVKVITNQGTYTKNVVSGKQ